MPEKQQTLWRLLIAFILIFSVNAFVEVQIEASVMRASPQQEKNKVKKVIVTVYDENSEPVIGAGVMVMSSRSGSITDLKGQATVEVIEGDELEITFIGYEAKKVTVGKSASIKVNISPSSLILDDAVVVGYGTQKKESVVAAISQVSNNALRRTGNTTNLAESLIGQVPGLVSLTSSGEPGGIYTGESATTLFIRGQNTWNGGSPLVLVDGVERPMNNVDVSEVEKVSVLKDASATAVFGVKGANGVILITTKRGATGKTKLNFNYTLTGKMVSKQPKKLDSYEAMMAKNEIIEREGVLNETSWDSYIPYEIVRRFKRPQTPEYEQIYPNVDWEKAMFDNFALNTHKLSLNIQGGGKALKYFGSMAYLHEGDMFKYYDNYKSYNPNYNFDRFNFRSNVDFDLTTTTKLQFNLSGFFSRKNTNWGNEGSGRADEWMWAATYALAPNLYLPKYNDGYWGTYWDGNNSDTNPAAVVYNLGVRQTRTTQLNADFHIIQNLDFITKGLKANASLYYDNTIRSEGGIYDNVNSARSSESGTNIRYKYIDFMKYEGPEQDPSEYTTYYPQSDSDYDWVIRPWSVKEESIREANMAGYIPVFRRMMYQVQLNWARKFDKHDVSAMGVFKREEYARGSMFKTYREDWVGRATYNYDSRYLLELNGAYNGSEKFGPGYRFDFFPSVALGWYLTNEKFFKVNWINKIKFRYALGKVGDDNIGGRWLYASSYSYGGRARLNQNVNGWSPYYMYRKTMLGNPNIHWEVATKSNIGVELAFFNDLLTLNFDYFTDNRKDILLSGNARSIPAFFGATPPSANIGRVNSKGFELEIGFNKQFNNKLFIWGKLGVNHNENKVLFKDDPQLQLNYLKSAGYQIGQIRSQISTGIYQNWDEVFASVPQESNDLNKMPGYYNILDFNADGIIKASEDTPPLGYSSIPQNTGTLSLGADWFGWSFMIQFYGANNASRVINFDNYKGNYDVVFGHVADFWSKDNPGASSFLPRWLTKGEFIGNYYVYDASFLRLQTVELSYTFNKNKLLKKIHCDNLRLFVNGNNLFFWSDLPDDRSSTYSGGGDATVGAYPTVKRISFGLDVSF